MTLFTAEIPGYIIIGTFHSFRELIDGLRDADCSVNILEIADILFERDIYEGPFKADRRFRYVVRKFDDIMQLRGYLR